MVLLTKGRDLATPTIDDHARLTRQYAAAIHSPAIGLPSGTDLIASDTENLRLVLAALDPDAAKERPRRLAALQADVALAVALLHRDGDPVVDQLAASVGRLSAQPGAVP
jgi:hypothetical protein